jgi:DNA-binding CsgD family transcriptional regulator/tetratricopeptide (TPR) repeat protein
MAARALALVEKDSLDEAAVLTQSASSWYVSISHEERRRQLARALRIARREHAPALEMRILSELSWTSRMNLDNSTAVRYAAKELALANRLGDLPAQCRALYDTVAADMDVTIGASVDKIRRDVEAFRAAAEKLRDRNWLVVAYLRCGKVAEQRADWPLAKEMNRLSLAHLPEQRDTTLPLLRNALIEYQTCDFDAGDQLLAQAVEIDLGHLPRRRDRTYVANYVTHLAIESGRVKWLDEVERFPLDVLEDGQSSPQERLDANVALGDIAVIRGDAEAAAACYAKLLALIPTDHLQRLDFHIGLIARTAGRIDDAVHHLREAVELSEKLEHQGRRIWNQYFLAETLVQRSRPHDLEEARRLLGGLLDVATRTGSTLVERRARALLETMSSSLPAPAAPAGPRRPDGLTEREVEVLRFIARGFTNTEIGEKLFISPYTVSTHVHRILEKTGMANRTEATSYAIRNGLAEP